MISGRRSETTYEKTENRKPGKSSSVTAAPSASQDTWKSPDASGPFSQVTVIEPPPHDTAYTNGVVAMAKTEAEPRGASGSQFFIVTADDAKLPPDYALVGGVVRGMDVAQRIARYANLVGRDNLMAGVDCGFSIHVGSGGVDPEVVWAKLGALAQGAAIASRRFWR